MPYALTFSKCICLQSRIDCRFCAIKLSHETGRLSSPFYVMINWTATHLQLRQNCSYLQLWSWRENKEWKSKRPDPEITDKQPITSPFLLSAISNEIWKQIQSFYLWLYLYVMQYITVSESNREVRLQKRREDLDFNLGPPGHRIDEVERVRRMKTTSQWRTVLRATNNIGRTVNEGDNADLCRW